MSDYHVESCVIVNPDEIMNEWIGLQQRANCSYFQSWSWIGTWLDQIAIELKPVVVRVRRNGDLFGMGVFVSRDITRRILFKSRALFLNEYPFDGCNMVIEYNGMLAVSGHEKEVHIETARHLLQKYKQHDEFYFGAIADQSLIDSSKELLKETNCFVNEESTAWYIELDHLSTGVDGYLSSLSRNRRGQIRRSIRAYDHDGSMQIEEACDLKQALHYFDQLKVLHAAYWNSKNQPGSFSNARWESFHRALIQKRFDLGEIQMLKVSSNYGEIGYIYNMVLQKHVYVMQTGFARSAEKHLMPGYVTHVLAIAHNKAKGMTVYDFMHGDDLYKRILCNKKEKLIWLVLQRKRMRFVVENYAVRLVRWLREVTSRAES